MRKRLGALAVILVGSCFAGAPAFADTRGHQAQQQVQHDDDGMAGLPMDGPAGQAQRILAHPLIQSLSRYMQTPQFERGSRRIMESPNKGMLLYLQIGWLILLFVVRAWRLSKLSVTNWGKILALNFGTFAAYVSGALFVLPWIVFGSAYSEMLAGLWRALK